MSLKRDVLEKLRNKQEKQDQLDRLVRDRDFCLTKIRAIESWMGECKQDLEQATEAYQAAERTLDEGERILCDLLNAVRFPIPGQEGA